MGGDTRDENAPTIAADAVTAPAVESKKLDMGNLTAAEAVTAITNLLTATSDDGPLARRRHPFLTVMSSMATMTVTNSLGPPPSPPRATLRLGLSRWGANPLPPGGFRFSFSLNSTMGSPQTAEIRWARYP